MFLCNPSGTFHIALQSDLRATYVYNVGSNASFYLDNVLTAISTTTTYQNLTPEFYCGTKWSVIVLNNTTFPIDSWEFMGIGTDITHHAYSGTKVGCIIYYNKVLTSNEIAAITKWGLERFGNF
jgi:hypothetical protein